jgi:hypothetical protein
MKVIKPVVFPLNLGTATLLNVSCTNDNLNNSANFSYTLLSEINGALQQGNLNMSGIDYDNWITNDYAYNWVAEKLKIEIVSE